MLSCCEGGPPLLFDSLAAGRHTDDSPRLEKPSRSLCAMSDYFRADPRTGKPQKLALFSIACRLRPAPAHLTSLVTLGPGAEAGPARSLDFTGGAAGSAPMDDNAAQPVRGASEREGTSRP